MTFATRLPFTILPATNLLGGRGVDVGFVLGTPSISVPDPPGGSLWDPVSIPRLEDLLHDNTQGQGTLPEPGSPFSTFLLVPSLKPSHPF